jgi:hypothetical protein
MDAALSKLFYQTIFYLTDEDKIYYYRYQAICFLKEEIQELYYEKAPLISKSLAAIIKTLMVKRLESSFNAFKISINNLLCHQPQIEMFEKRKIFMPRLNINSLMEKGMSMDEIEELIIELSAENPKNNVFTPDNFEPEFLDGLHRDFKNLQELKDQWAKVTVDPKLENFIDLLMNEVFRKDLNPTGKLVIFTDVRIQQILWKKTLKTQLQKVLSVSAKNRIKP